ncbi:MAG TPA: polysaccharide deacetylase family protein [Gillisia sp.]|nr:polysaccharide deacetylase family protein [Gillisia sp.]
MGKVVFPSLLWNFNVNEKCIYLTFDDGPIPEITPWVLETLLHYNAKATFFCIGDNVTKHPEIFQMILRDGHTIGNHSHNHLDGWKTEGKTYVENVLKAEVVIEESSALIKSMPPSQSAKKYFRPPYGRIRPSQIKELESLGYKIVMWDVISGDYDQTRSPHTCIQDVIRYSGPGSILVLHDSLKSFINLQKILPEILKHYSEEGFEFKSL